MERTVWSGLWPHNWGVHHQEMPDDSATAWSFGMCRACFPVDIPSEVCQQDSEACLQNRIWDTLQGIQIWWLLDSSNRILCRSLAAGRFLGQYNRECRLSNKPRDVFRRQASWKFNYKLTSFRRLAFHVAIWSLLVMVKLIELTITLFREDWAAGVGPEPRRRS